MVRPADVHETLRRHVLVDGYDLVLDLAASRGSWLVDARDGSRYLDLFSHYASAPLGMNHRALADDPAFRDELAAVALNKPANSDIYSVPMAEFVTTFARVLGDPALPYLFFVEGGTLAVENALKAAFDWKSRHNQAAGRSPYLGTKVLHLTRAFHGRSGYTLSVTNTDAAKIARYPKFDWPRVDAPVVRFPLAVHRADVEVAEGHALDQATAAFARHPHDIACFLAEPIQGEGGDNHLRPEFLQAMQGLCHAHDALFVLDEVQTGVGLTGSNWAYQQLGLQPDLVAFGKKLQVCGVMGGGRLNEVADHVFRVPSRIASTWGGNLTDMVRARRILEVIEKEELVARAGRIGEAFARLLEALAARHPAIDNVRGRGLMRALDLPDRGMRDEVVARLYRDERTIVLPGGERSVRFRPALTVTEDELAQACDAFDRVLGTAASSQATTSSTPDRT